MKSLVPGGYRFATPAHWARCLIGQADVGSEGIRPSPPLLAQAEPLYADKGAFAPSRAPTGELVWRIGSGKLCRAMPGDALTEVLDAPGALARAMRLVATSSDYWAIGDAPGTLEVFEATSLSRRFVVALDGQRLIDIAALGRHGIAVLAERDGCLRATHLDCDGQVLDTAVLHGLDDAVAFAAMCASTRYAVLGADGHRVFAYNARDGSELWRLALPTIAPCFVADAFASDGRKRLFVAGRDDPAAHGRAHLLVFDQDGVLADDVPLAEQATGLAAARDALFVTGSRGLYRLDRGVVVPDDRAEVRATLLTPVLEAPDVSDGRRWLRMEAKGDLPAGATLEFAWAATDDEAIRDQVVAIADNASLPPGNRLRSIQAVEGIWAMPVSFQGASRGAGEMVLSAAPLYDVRGRFVWALVSLSAGAGAGLPSLQELRVLYPGSTLMGQLPSIYRRDEAQSGQFLRSLVGLLETTTQDLDTRITGLARHIQPETASGAWLDLVARWLGLPWDDALDIGQKRSLVLQAEAIARSRGTRAGLHTFLDAVVAGSSARYRTVDVGVDYGIATVGGNGCPGSALPALLGGAPSASARLGVRAQLGLMRLPCNGEEEDAHARFLGWVRVDCSANAADTARWSPWMAALIQEMLPVNCRLSLRWLGAGALDRLAGDGVLTLQAPPDARLGVGAVIGRAHLPRRGDQLPVVGTHSGPVLH